MRARVCVCLFVCLSVCLSVCALEEVRLLDGAQDNAWPEDGLLSETTRRRAQEHQSRVSQVDQTQRAAIIQLPKQECRTAAETTSAHAITGVVKRLSQRIVSGFPAGE